MCRPAEDPPAPRQHPAPCSHGALELAVVLAASPRRRPPGQAEPLLEARAFLLAHYGIWDWDAAKPASRQPAGRADDAASLAV